MKNVLFAAATAMMIVAVAPAFAGPAYEAEQDYPGWLAALTLNAPEAVLRAPPDGYTLG
jgi:hypothetical protein